MKEGAPSASTPDGALEALIEHRPEALFCALGDDGFRIPVPASLKLAKERVIPVPSDRATMIDLVVAAEQMVVVTTWERARSAGIAISIVRSRSDPDQQLTLTILDVRSSHGVWVGALSASESDATGSGALARPLLAPLRPRTATIHKNMFAVITAIDDRASRMLGWAPEQLVGVRSLEFIHPDDQDRAVTNWMEMLGRQEGQRVRYRHRCHDGTWLWVEVENVYRGAEDPDDVVVVAQMSDISDEMAAHDAVHRREQLFRRLAESLPTGVLQVEPDRTIAYANARLAAMLGVRDTSTLDGCLATIVPSDRGELEGAFVAVLDHGVGRDLEVQVRMPGTLELRRCTVKLTALTDDEGTPGALVCVDDITNEARMREELRVRATFDVLTGCYNRASVMAAIDQELLRDAESLTAIIFVDLDNFKPVNDEMGHATGDELLVVVAERLKGIVRGADILGRIGGDEFLILCRQLDSRDVATAIAHRVADALRCQFELSTGAVQLRASVGVAFSDPYSTSESLVARADAAMYKSKRQAQGVPAISD